MEYFDCTRWAFISWLIFLTPLVIIWIFGFFIDKLKKPITRFRLNIMYLLTIVYVGTVYYGTFAHFFFGINVLPSGNSIEIMRLYPERSTTLNIRDIAGVKTEPSYKGNFQMIIQMKNGKKFEGAPSNRLDVDNKVKLVKAALPQ